MEEKEIKTSLLTLAEKTESVAVGMEKIRSDKDMTVTGLFLVDCKDVKKRILETFDPIVESAHKTHKKAIEMKKQFLKPIENAISVVSKLMSDYRLEQERKQKALEEEQRRIEAEKERERIAEEERIMKEAEKAEEEGDAEKVEEILSQAPEVQKVEKVENIVKKVEGIQFRTYWKYAITNAAIVPREFLVINPVLINKEVQAKKENCNIPGIRVYSEKKAI